MRKGKRRGGLHHYRRDAWNEEQAGLSNEREWRQETRRPSGYLNHIPYPRNLWNYAQAETEAPSIGVVPIPYEGYGDWVNKGADRSKYNTYVHKDHAWSEEQFDYMNEKTWAEETEAPTKYQWTLGAAAQLSFPGETNSKITDETKNRQAWTHEQFDHMNEKQWQKETDDNYSGYVKPASLSQYWGETNSKILPYNQREHAWSEEQFDAMNPFTWEEETNNPTGYAYKLA